MNHLEEQKRDAEFQILWNALEKLEENLKHKKTFVQISAYWRKKSGHYYNITYKGKKLKFSANEKGHLSESNTGLNGTPKKMAQQLDKLF